MIVFQNPGLIDLAAVTTMGVSVKEGDTPIGFFGTGLKFAIATILRNGGGIELYRGGDRHVFGIEPGTVRGEGRQDFPVPPTVPERHAGGRSNLVGGIRAPSQRRLGLHPRFSELAVRSDARSSRADFGGAVLMTRVLSYALPLALGALAACGVFVSAEAVERSGHNPFLTPAPADNDAHAPGKSVGGEIE